MLEFYRCKLDVIFDKLSKIKRVDLTPDIAFDYRLYYWNFLRACTNALYGLEACVCSDSQDYLFNSGRILTKGSIDIDGYGHAILGIIYEKCPLNLDVKLIDMNDLHIYWHFSEVRTTSEQPEYHYIIDKMIERNLEEYSKHKHNPYLTLFRSSTLKLRGLTNTDNSAALCLCIPSKINDPLEEEKIKVISMIDMPENYRGYTENLKRIESPYYEVNKGFVKRVTDNNFIKNVNTHTLSQSDIELEQSYYIPEYSDVWTPNIAKPIKKLVDVEPTTYYRIPELFGGNDNSNLKNIILFMIILIVILIIVIIIIKIISKNKFKLSLF